MTDLPDVGPKVRRVIVNLCEPCIRGEGQECHTPGCVLCFHRVDLPIMEELLEDAPDPSSLTPAEVRVAELEKALRKYASHPDTCESFKAAWRHESAPCTCGLGALLQPAAPGS